MEDGLFVQKDLCVCGEGGYHTYRIPTIVRTTTGTLLAFCEGRKFGIGDAGAIDLLLWRSEDGGASWGPKRVLVAEDPDSRVTCGNPTPVVDRQSGRISLLFCRNNQRVFATHSMDEGESWAEPREITEAFRPFPFPWKRIGMGPVNGIQLEDGRLAAPLWLNDQIGGVYQAGVALSDDGGLTWRPGGLLSNAVQGCNESTVAEPEPGLLVMSSRNADPAKRRATAFSRDGGETWASPHLDAALPAAPCQGSLIAAAGAAPTRPLLLSFPAWTQPPADQPGKTQRKRLAVWLSEDGGQTWPHARILQPGRAEYSNLVEVGDGQFGCLYERGADKLYHMAALTFVQFDWAWLRAQNDACDIRANT